MITVVLAEGHEAVRRGIRDLLELEDDLEIVGETDGKAETVHLIERLRPRVIVIGLLMSHSGGLALAQQIGSRSPSTRIVFVSVYPDEAYVAKAIHAGAHAYVDLDRTATDLATTIRIIAQGTNRQGVYRNRFEN